MLLWSALGRKAAAVQAESDYVDPGTCAGCHGEIAKSYSETGMGRSFRHIDTGATIEGFGENNTVYNGSSEMHYTMLERDGRLYEKRSQAGLHGEETNIVEEQIDYVIGSGNHARTYLHRDAQGKLIELPVSWYAEQSGYWAMSPGYDRKDQKDFGRAIPAGCMFCHNAYPAALKSFGPGSADPPAFPKTLPEGIDCQRCHGPGRAHVRAAISGASREAIRSAIVNPAKLDRERQLDVCMQCHLETSSSHLPNQIVRYDRNAFGYRPGQPLGQFQLYFEPLANESDDRFEIAHAAYRLRKSACFLKSQMTCLTCHDPHKSYRGPGMMGHYIAVCEGCHASVQHTAALPPTSTCISCHMPARRTDDAVHVAMTDHYIQRVRPDRDLLASFTEADKKPAAVQGIRLYYPSQLPLTQESELYLAVADAKDGSQGAKGIERLRSALVKYPTAAPEFYFELAHAYGKAGHRDEAVRWYEEALRRRPVYPTASKELAATLLDQGHLAQAAEHLKQASLASPTDEQLLADLGNVYLRRGQIAAARQTLLRALDVNPSLAQAENLMGMIELQSGNRAEAEKSFRGAIRDDPSLAEAHSNLGNLLAGKAEYEEAAYEFQKAIWIYPDYGEAHHGYALVLELTHSYDQAVSELRQAARLNPTDSQTHGDLADLLAARGDLDGAADEYQTALAHSAPSSPAELRSSLGNVFAAQGKSAEAEQQFETAIQLKPDFYEAHLGLALVLAKEGKLQQARTHCEKAAQSEDAAIRGAALGLLRQLSR
ncbi:MAG TPA: tetratricopeptide repeat protein [Terracidiphilus sp.]|nr:tetratricopeptide repeat protein [Terracidiphilus sp.]